MNEPGPRDDERNIDKVRELARRDRMELSAAARRELLAEQRREEREDFE